MIRTSLRLLAVSGLVGLAACGGKQNTETTVIEEPVVLANASVRALHAALATGVNVTVGTNAIGSTITAGAGTDVDTVVPGEVPVIVTSASGSTTLFEGTVSLEPGGDYIVVVYGSAAGNTIAAAAVDARWTTPAEGAAHVRFFNAAGNTGSVEVTSEGRSYATGLGFGAHSDWVAVPAGTAPYSVTGTSGVSAESSVALLNGRGFLMVAHETAEGVGLVTLAL